MIRKLIKKTRENNRVLKNAKKNRRIKSPRVSPVSYISGTSLRESISTSETDSPTADDRANRPASDVSEQIQAPTTDLSSQETTSSPQLEVDQDFGTSEPLYDNAQRIYGLPNESYLHSSLWSNGLNAKHLTPQSVSQLLVANPIGSAAKTPNKPKKP